MGIRPDICSALNVVMAPIDICAATGTPGIAECEHQHRTGPRNGVAVGVLRLTHCPDDEPGTIVGKHFGRSEHLFLRDTGDFLNDSRCVFGHDLFLDLVHTVHALIDKFLVFPAILKDVIQQAEQNGDIRTRANTHKPVSFGRRSRKARIGNNNFGAIFFCVQRVQHRHRMCFGRI